MAKRSTSAKSPAGGDGRRAKKKASPAKPKKRAAKTKKSTGAAPKRKSTKKSSAKSAARPKGAEPAQGEGSGHLVVGIGASAGGLEAFTALLEHLPTDTGMAFVLVQHLDPRQKSNLVEILARTTEMPIAEAVDGVRLEPNCIYVSPASMDLALLNGVLTLMPRPESRARHLPIDSFYRSLAQDQGNRAIGVILSGTGSDGALGLGTVKAEGGITFAQDQGSAKYGGMPASAVSAGSVDSVLPPAQIAQELARIGRHPHLERATGRQPEVAMADAPEDLQKIFVILRRATGVDFSQYKRSTVERRLSRRMVLHRIDSIRHYTKYLQETPDEVGTLFEDMLINVTGFFRDPATFEVLKAKVIPSILRDKRPEADIRVWVPGCSTGEEAYSIAIALIEYLDDNSLQSPIQVFATDVSDLALDKARSGTYPETIVADVSQDRLRRFFTPVDPGYQINKMIRDMCIFAKQDVTKDPPFSRLDLLSCRNLLIYLGPILQKKIIPAFHYALNPARFLMLGTSETIGGFADLFSLVDRKQKIYTKKSAVPRLPIEFGVGEFPVQPEPKAKATPTTTAPAVVLQQEADRIVLSEYAPPGVVINEQMEIFQFRGKTGRYLEPAPGDATLNLLKMAREGLLLDLRATVHKARVKSAPVKKTGLRVPYNGQTLVVDLEVVPIGPPEWEEKHFLVLFHESPTVTSPPEKAEAEPSDATTERAEDAGKEMERLDELSATRETLQTIIEEHESTNEELRAANEEIQSANEELQSTNEELETAKEELQSTNEELTTLNEELENRNDELTQAINDLNNLLNSVNIPIVILGNDLRIRTFTPLAEKVLKLIPADSGRPISELKLGIQVENLEAVIMEVIDTLNAHEQAVQADDGRRYVMRIRPYRTTDDKIAGAVIALIDTTDQEDARIYAESVVATVREPLLILDEELRVVSANRAFYEFFETTERESVHRRVYELGDGQWDIPRLRELLTNIIPKDASFDDYDVEHEFPGIGRKKLILNARRVAQAGDRPQLILLAMQEASDEGKQP